MEELVIRRAEMKDYETVRQFYYDVIDGFQTYEFKPMWEKDIYPSREQLKTSIGLGEYYMGLLGEKMVCGMIMNHSWNDGYDSCPWRVDAKREEVTVLHALGVLCGYTGRGFAKALVSYAIAEAKKNGGKAMRLDVLEGNIPANRLYEAFGYEKISTLSLFYDDTGWMNFELYELAI